MRSATYRPLTLALHPNSQGFGWVAFSSPLVPYDWGNVGAPGKNKNERCLRRVERLLNRLDPHTVVLEAFEQHDSLRRPRLIKLCRAIVALAGSRGIDVAIYAFEEVKTAFAHVGASSRSAIAHAVGRMFNEFAHLVPAMRKNWHREHWRLSLFCAAALILTHFQRDAEGLLESLSSQQ